MADSYEDRAAAKVEQSRRIQSLEDQLLKTKRAALQAIQVCNAHRSSVNRVDYALQQIVKALQEVADSVAVR